MLVPKLRFKEFNDEWNYKLFNEIFEFIQNNSFSRDMLNYSENSKIYNIHYGDILTKYGEIIDFNLISNIVPKINNDISLSKFEDKSYLKNGDIIIADTAEDLTVGKSCEVVNLHCKALAGLHTIPCRPKFKFTSQYLGMYINSTSYHSQLIPYITGIKVSSISKNNIIKTKIYFPTIKEQEKISELFSLLNKKIELQQRKIEVLKMYKRGFMKKNLNNIIDSNLIKLKDIYKFIYGEGNTNPDNGGIYPVYGANGIIGGFDRYNAEESVIIGHMGAYAGNVLFEKNKHFVTYNGTIAIPKDVNKLRPKFGYYILLNANLPKICAGSGMPFLSYETLNNIKVKLPNIEIQQKYEEIFDNIEIKICNEEKKLIYLNELKKSLLQKMFI